MAAACSPEIYKNKMDKLVDKWYGDRLTVALTEKNPNYFKKMYRAATGQDFDFGDRPTLKELDRFGRRIDEFQSRIRNKVPGKLAEYFYLPEEFLKGNPVARKVFDQFVINHNYYRGEKEKYDFAVSKMVTDMRKIAQYMSVSRVDKAFKTISYIKAKRELDRRHNEYSRLLAEGATNPAKAVQAEQYYQKHIKNLGKKEQFKVFDMVDKLLRNPELLTKPETKSRYSIYKPILSQWQDIRPQLFNSLKNSLGGWIKTLESQENIKDYRYIISRLKTLNEKLIPDKDYFPTQLLNIFPTVKSISDSIYETRETGKTNLKDLNKYVDAMVTNVLEKVPISDHVIPKQGSVKERYNKNIISVLDQYTRDVTRFNYLVRTSSTLIDGVRKLRDLSNKETEDSTKVYIDYLHDTHATMLGYNIKSPQWKSITRGITSWQFISKLGLNIRSPLKNGTQSLQNYNYFGAKAWYESGDYIKTQNISDLLTAEKKRHGIYFAESREMVSAVGLFPETVTSKVNGQEVLAWKYDSVGDKILKGLETTAKITGKPMTWVENNINRDSTFNIAFATRHKQLNSNRGDIERFINEHPEFFTDTKYGKTISEKVNKHMAKESGSFAADMVKQLHYEYSSFAKPKVLRTPGGAILGQFATYSINFFNYQRKIVKRGASDIVNGDWSSPEAWRAYRLGMMALAVEGLSIVANSDFSSLVQNDTIDRIKQYLTLASGDDDEKRRAFFGKGPIIGTLGGPFIADLVTLGNVFGFYKLLLNFETGDNSLLGYLAGYDDYAGSRKDQKLYDVVRTFNTEIARQTMVIGPRMYDGAGFGEIAQMQLGIYPSKYYKNIKSKILKAVGAPTPKYAESKDTKKSPQIKQPDISQALMSVAKVAGRKRYNQNYNRNIMKTLDSLA